MATLLSDYLAATRRFLHDASGQYYSDQELQAYINEARVRIVRDTGSYRKLQTLNTVASQETYTFASAFPQGNDTIDVLGVSVIWGQTRYACAYMPWGEFQIRARTWTNQIGQPSVFSTYAQTTLYLSYVPDQVYPIECDTVVAPPYLLGTTGVTTVVAPGTIGCATQTVTAEVIPIPFTSPVPFFAAHLAKFKEQSWADADLYAKKYDEELRRALGSAFTRRLKQPYG